MPKKTTKSSGNKSSNRQGNSKAEPKKTARTEEKAQSSRLKDILMLVVFAVSLIAMIALFTETIQWMRNGMYFLFGIMMYAVPFLVPVIFILLFYHKKSPAFLRRAIAAVLFWFALSGIFSFAMTPLHGGLLGRADYAMFHGWLGRAGSFVINGLLIAVSIALVLDVSVFQYFETVTSRSKEKQELYQARRDRRELERQREELEDRENTANEIEAERRKAEAYRKYIDEKQEQERRKRERFSNHYYGIGDTKIVDDGPAKKTVFMNTEEDEDPEETVFFDPSKAEKPESRHEEVPFVEGRSDSGETVSTEPKITFGEQFFKNTDNDDAFSEDAEENEQYTKMVITKNGRVVEASDGTSLRQGTSGRPSGVKASESRETAELPKEEGTPHQMTINEVVEKHAKDYQFPPLKLLKRGMQNLSSRSDLQRELNENAAKLKQTFENFGVGVTVTSISCGPSVTRYEIQQDVGVKVSKIVSLKDEIQQSLAASDIRIEAPIPGKSAIGIEIPNRTKTGVYLRDLLESDDYKESKSKLSYGLGRGIDGKVIISDLAKMPHLLVAGTTGSGKSVCLNTMIMSVLYHAKPTEVKMIMIDPKMVEFAQYNGIPHLLLPVVTDAKKASMALAWAASEMDKRYESFANFGVRNIEGFNQYVEMEEPEDESGIAIRPMPLILIFVDEFSDLMMAASKEVEANVVRLAQKARAAGIHLVLATQSPRANVLTGLIKANIPSRIALSVASDLESRIIIDMNGAETLLGHGDMLYLPIGANKPVRVQGAYVSDEEIRDVVNYILKAGPVKGGGVNENVDLSRAPEEAKNGSQGGGNAGNGRDELFQEVGRFVIEKQKASIGALQRAFSIGFNRAARIMDQLADAGVVGEEEGTKPRRILMNAAEFDELVKSL